MGKFRQIFMELPARDTIMAGYCSFKVFVFASDVCPFVYLSITQLCPPFNLKTVQDTFTKLHQNIVIS